MINIQNRKDRSTFSVVSVYIFQGEYQRFPHFFFFNLKYSIFIDNSDAND